MFFDYNYYYYIAYFTYFLLDYEINYRIYFKDSVIYSIKKILRSQKQKKTDNIKIKTIYFSRVAHTRSSFRNSFN